MGFNNDGVDVLVANVKASRFYREKKGILGLSIGKNAVTPIEKAVDDYLICLEKIYPVADYIAINISSPNTKNLRQLQGESELDNLLSQLKAAQDRLAQQYGRYVPLALKIAPDIDNNQIRNIADALLRHHIDGVIATNTTISRDAVNYLPYGSETGGLSGAPVKDMSTAVIRKLKAELGDTIPIIGVGGILSGDDAREKIEAGAITGPGPDRHDLFRSRTGARMRQRTETTLIVRHDPHRRKRNGKHAENTTRYQQPARVESLSGYHDLRRPEQ